MPSSLRSHQGRSHPDTPSGNLTQGWRFRERVQGAWVVVPSHYFILYSSTLPALNLNLQRQTLTPQILTPKEPDPESKLVGGQGANVPVNSHVYDPRKTHKRSSLDGRILAPSRVTQALRHKPCNSVDFSYPSWCRISSVTP